MRVRESPIVLRCPSGDGRAGGRRLSPRLLEMDEPEEGTPRDADVDAQVWRARERSWVRVARGFLLLYAVLFAFLTVGLLTATQSVLVASLGVVGVVAFGALFALAGRDPGRAMTRAVRIAAVFLVFDLARLALDAEGEQMKLIVRLIFGALLLLLFHRARRAAAALADG